MTARHFDIQGRRTVPTQSELSGSLGANTTRPTQLPAAVHLSTQRPLGGSSEPSLYSRNEAEHDRAALSFFVGVGLSIAIVLLGLVIAASFVL